MYIESKAAGLNGAARIGRVSFSKTGRTLHYGDLSFLRVKGGYKYNCVRVDEENYSEEWWISGPRRDGRDRLYVCNLPIEVDDDVREEYWTSIRKQPERKHEKFYLSPS